MQLSSLQHASPAPTRAEPLDPDRLSDHIDALYRAAWALCGSRHDAEDLVQETFAAILRRPRFVRHGSELGYLLRTLRNTYFNHVRIASRRPVMLELREDDSPSAFESRSGAHQIMEAIASLPVPYRDAVIAVDVLGLSYREAAHSLRTREATVTSRLHRGRARIARALTVTV